MDRYTIRDVSFYDMCKAMKVQALDMPRHNINVECGYGGVRLLDCRWLGPVVFEELVDCVKILEREDGGSLNIVGSSAGNIITASLAILLPLRRLCCGFYNNTDRRRRFQVDQGAFIAATNLRIPPEDLCACDTVRRIYDFLFEITALSEHPSWCDYTEGEANVEGASGTKREKNIKKVSKTRSIPIKKLSYQTISNIFSGKQTVESTLSFSDEVASAFTNMYLSEPVRYATVMYRVIDDLQGKMNLAYILSRHLLTRCSTLQRPSEEIDPNSAAPLSINIGSKDIQSDRFVFTDIVNLKPLSRLVPGLTLRPSDYKKDAEAMNEMLRTLISGVDMREIFFPILSEFIWKRKNKLLDLREDADPETVLRGWKWDGKVPSYDRHDDRLMKRTVLPQDTVDIMSNTKGHLPNFTEAMGGGANYIFEISPLGKHLFSTDSVNGLFQACTPGLNVFQIKAVHSRQGHKIATLINGTPFVSGV